jgi:hypothetical protein
MIIHILPLRSEGKALELLEVETERLAVRLRFVGAKTEGFMSHCRLSFRSAQ